MLFSALNMSIISQFSCSLEMIHSFLLQVPSNIAMPQEIYKQMRIRRNIKTHNSGKENVFLTWSSFCLSQQNDQGGGLRLGQRWQVIPLLFAHFHCYFCNWTVTQPFKLQPASAYDRLCFHVVPHLYCLLLSCRCISGVQTDNSTALKHTGTSVICMKSLPSYTRVRITDIITDSSRFYYCM